MPSSEACGCKCQCQGSCSAFAKTSLMSAADVAGQVRMSCQPRADGVFGQGELLWRGCHHEQLQDEGGGHSQRRDTAPGCTHGRHPRARTLRAAGTSLCGRLASDQRNPSLVEQARGNQVTCLPFHSACHVRTSACGRGAFAGRSASSSHLSWHTSPYVACYRKAFGS